MFNEQRFNEIIAELENLFANNEVFEIDISDLDSYEYTPARTWNYNYNPEPPEEDFDEDEFYAAQLNKAIDYITADGLYQYFDIDEKEEEIYQPKVIEWLEKELEKTGY